MAEEYDQDQPEDEQPEDQPEPDKQSKEEAGARLRRLAASREQANLTEDGYHGRGEEGGQESAEDSLDHAFAAETCRHSGSLCTQPFAMGDATLQNRGFRFVPVQNIAHSHLQRFVHR